MKSRWVRFGDGLVLSASTLEVTWGCLKVRRGHLFAGSWAFCSLTMGEKIFMSCNQREPRKTISRSRTWALLMLARWWSILRSMRNSSTCSIDKYVYHKTQERISVAKKLQLVTSAKRSDKRANCYNVQRTDKVSCWDCFAPRMFLPILNNGRSFAKMQKRCFIKQLVTLNDYWTMDNGELFSILKIL